MPELSDRDRAILQFEEARPRVDDNKQAAIRKTFELSPTRYYQLLNALIERPEALRANPVVVKRLLRQRDERMKSRILRKA